MFQDTMDERSGVDLSPPGVLEEEIGKFVAREDPKMLRPRLNQVWCHWSSPPKAMTLRRWSQ